MHPNSKLSSVVRGGRAPAALVGREWADTRFCSGDRIRTLRSWAPELQRHRSQSWCIDTPPALCYLSELTKWIITYTLLSSLKYHLLLVANLGQGRSITASSRMICERKSMDCVMSFIFISWIFHACFTPPVKLIRCLHTACYSYVVWSVFFITELCPLLAQQNIEYRKNEDRNSF